MGDFEHETVKYIELDKHVQSALEVRLALNRCMLQLICVHIRLRAPFMRVGICRQEGKGLQTQASHIAGNNG